MMDNSCISEFPISDSQTIYKNVNSPYHKNPNFKCELKSSKKIQFYTFTYEPKKILNNIDKTYDEINNLYKNIITENIVGNINDIQIDNEKLNKQNNFIIDKINDSIININKSKDEKYITAINKNIKVLQKEIDDNKNKINKNNNTVAQYNESLLANIDVAKKNIFDDRLTTNCCNVISITLYLSFDDINYIYENVSKYILSIYRTIKNVESDLKGWIVRIYFDDSVYCVIKKLNDINDDKYKILIEKFNYINNSNIVEIYTYDCPDDTKNKYLNRTLRFLPFINNDVNTCICRDADGIVSRLDCHNIKVFANSDKLFYLPFYDFIHPYSRWIGMYADSRRNMDVQQYDLLAGAFGINLRVKTEHYNNCLEIVHDYFLNNTFYNKRIYEYNPKSYIFSFDECLLYEIFAGYINISTPIKYYNGTDKFDYLSYELLEIIEKNLFIARLNTRIEEIPNKYNIIENKNNIPFLINGENLEKYNELIDKNRTQFKNLYIRNDVAKYYAIDAIIDIDKLDQNITYNFIDSETKYLGILNIPYNINLYEPLYDFGQKHKKIFGGGNINYKKMRKYLYKNNTIKIKKI
jgi:hypothetical protein